MSTDPTLELAALIGSAVAAGATDRDALLDTCQQIIHWRRAHEGTARPSCRERDYHGVADTDAKAGAG